MQTFSQNLSIINMLVFKVEIDIIYKYIKNLILNIYFYYNLYIIYNF